MPAMMDDAMPYKAASRFTDFGLQYCAASVVLVALCGTGIAQEPVEWKVGTALQRQMEVPVSVTWPSTPLRQSLDTLSRSVGVAVLLDRRVDPDQRIDIAIREKPLQTVLAEIAAAAHAQTAVIGSVVYFGPAQAVAKLLTVVAMRQKDVSQLPAAAQARLLRTQPWRWDELAEPKAIVNDLMRQGGVTLDNPELIPHDLWPAVSLPPLPWVDRLSLVASNFDLTFAFAEGGKRVRLMPMPQVAVVEKVYTIRGLPQEVATQLRQIAPSAKTRMEQEQLVVAASQDEHDKIEQLLARHSARAKKQSTKPGPADKRYSMQVANEPAGAVIRTVANQLGKEMKAAPALIPKLRQPVNLNVKDVTLDELLTTTLRPLGLSYRLSDTALEVIAAE
jgi:hypothetical protein